MDRIRRLAPLRHVDVALTGANGKPIKEKNGDKCGKQTAQVRWAVGSYSQGGGKTKLAEQKGNPAHFKLYNNDVIGLYFVPKSQNLTKLGGVPSETNLPLYSQSSQSSAPTTTTPGVTTTVKPGSTATTTVKPGTATTTAPPTTSATSTTPTTTKP